MILLVRIQISSSSCRRRGTWEGEDEAEERSDEVKMHPGKLSTQT